MGIIVRTIAGVVIALIAWFALGTIGFIAVDLAWPEFAAANKAFNSTQAVLFDQPMMIARISVAAAASIISAWLAALTVRDNRIAPLAGGLVLLALFVPNHIAIWDKFPLWYHLTFLSSLPVLAFLCGKLARA